MYCVMGVYNLCIIYGRVLLWFCFLLNVLLSFSVINTRSHRKKWIIFTSINICSVVMLSMQIYYDQFIINWKRLRYCFFVIFCRHLCIRSFVYSQRRIKTFVRYFMFIKHVDNDATKICIFMSKIAKWQTIFLLCFQWTLSQKKPQLSK